MSEERDIVTFTDEQGDEFDLEVLDYFFYNGQEYAVLADLEDEDCDCECCGHDHDHEHADGCDCGCEGEDQEIYIMKVIQLENDMEEFVPVEDELMEKLIEVVQARMDADLDDDE